MSDYVTITMVRPNLRNIPDRPLPMGYSLRLYRPGDDQAWIRIWKAAEEGIGLLQYSKISQEVFDSNFGKDLKAMERRCFFLLGPDGVEVGTTTAWYDYKYAGQHWGRVHWVAIVPEHQGKGLSKPMLSAAMRRMWEIGHRRCILGTQTARLAAIKTYLDYGFVPDLTAKGSLDAWRGVQAKLNHPALVSLG